jgi:hypothetical protein
MCLCGVKQLRSCTGRVNVPANCFEQREPVLTTRIIFSSSSMSSVRLFLRLTQGEAFTPEPFVKLGSSGLTISPITNVPLWSKVPANCFEQREPVLTTRIIFSSSSMSSVRLFLISGQRSAGAHPGRSVHSRAVCQVGVVRADDKSHNECDFQLVFYVIGETLPHFRFFRYSS